MSNLLNNAIKFTQPGGRITVRLTQQRQMAVLVVSDTGIGIPDDEQERLFSPLLPLLAGHRRRDPGHRPRPVAGAGRGRLLRRHHRRRLRGRQGHRRSPCGSRSAPPEEPLPAGSRGFAVWPALSRPDRSGRRRRQPTTPAHSDHDPAEQHERGQAVLETRLRRAPSGAPAARPAGPATSADTAQPARRTARSATSRRRTAARRARSGRRMRRPAGTRRRGPGRALTSPVPAERPRRRRRGPRRRPRAVTPMRHQPPTGRRRGRPERSAVSASRACAQTDDEHDAAQLRRRRTSRPGSRGRRPGRVVAEHRVSRDPRVRRAGERRRMAMMPTNSQRYSRRLRRGRGRCPPARRCVGSGSSGQGAGSVSVGMDV